MVSACSDLIAFDGFSSNFVYTCKLRVSGMGLLMSKFCQFYMKMAGIIVSLSFFFPMLLANVSLAHPYYLGKSFSNWLNSAQLFRRR